MSPKARMPDRMCLGIPARVVAVDERTAVVDLRGARRTVDATMVPVRPGDYVLVYTGLIVQVLDPEDAAERLRILEEVEGTAVPP